MTFIIFGGVGIICGVYIGWLQNEARVEFKRGYRAGWEAGMAECEEIWTEVMN